MAYVYNHRVTSSVATDDIPTVQYRRNSRRLSEIKSISLTDEISASNYQRLDSLKHYDEDDAGDEDYVYKEEYYSPEGPWGWAIVFAAFGANFVVDGISLSYGVMIDELTANLMQNETETDSGNITTTAAVDSGVEFEGEKPFPPNTSSSLPTQGSITITQLNTVGSVLLAVTLLMGPWASVIAERFGFRKTAVCGSIIATIGIFSSYILSPHEPNFWAFVIGFGVLGGIGFGILFTTSVVIVGLYFKKNRALATGFTVAGTGVGTLTMAPVMKEILRSFGWQGAILFQTLLCAISTLFGLVYRPIPKRKVKVRKSELKNVGNKTVMQQVKELLCSPSYMLVSISGCFIMMGYFAPFGFLYDSAKPYVGEQSAVLLLTYLGTANTIGRILFGLLANKVGHSLEISNAALTVGGLITALYPFAKTHGSLISCSVVFGLYSAVFASLRSIVIVNIVGEEKLNVGFGLSLMFMGVATLFSNSLGGLIKDTTGSYDMSFYVAGGFLILSAVMCYPVPCVHRREKAELETDDDLDFVDDMDGYKGAKAHKQSLVDISVNN